MTFLISAIFGAIVLLVHAHQLFYDPSLKSIVSKGRFPILKGVEIDRLSRPQAQIRGYLFYVSTYLAIYLLALAVTELGNSALQTAASVDESGGQGMVPTLAAADKLLDGNGNTRPLAVALAMVALMSARSQSGKTIRKLEGVLRNYAHRLAGIPHSIYRLITRLNRVDFEAVVGDLDAPHLQTFDTLSARADADVTRSALMQTRVSTTRDTLRAIDTLAVSVLGQTEIFPVDTTEPLAQLLKRGEKEFKTLSDRLQALSHADPSELTEDEFRQLHDMSVDCLRNLKALFAVLYSQTDLDMMNESHAPTVQVVASLRQPDKYRIVDKAVLAVVIACFASLPLYTINAMAQSEGGLSGTMGELRDSFFDILIFLVRAAALLVIAIATSIRVRRAAIDTEDWPDWRIKNAPVALLLWSSLWPAILAALVATAALVMLYAGFVFVNTSEVPSRDTMETIVAFEAVYIGIYIPLAMVISLATYVIADQHLNWSSRRTITVGGIFAIPFVVLALIGFVWLAGTDSAALERAVRDALTMGLFVLVVMMLLAFFIERAEDTEPAPAEMV